LISNNLVGLLDDAILVDAAMDTLPGELDDYAEFCRYRAGEAALLGVTPAQIRTGRESCQRERRLELRLEQQLRRARRTTCSRSNGGATVFRIC